MTATRATHAWQPVLTGRDRAHALEMVSRIAVAVRDAPAAASCDVSTGSGGSALFLAYAAGAPGCCWAYEVASRMLEHAALGDDPASLQPGLLAGIGGVALVAEHLTGSHVDELVRRTEALVRSVPSTMDLVFGTAGTLLLALASESVHAPALRAACVEDILSSSPIGCLGGRVGVAHGIAGVIGAASQALPALTLLDRARMTTWLEAAAGQLMVLWQERRLTAPGPRSRGWCVGDLGVVSALAVAVSSELPSIAKLAADSIAAAVDHCLDHPAPQCVSLCHGSAGIGLLYHRLWHATREDRFLRAARRWYQHVLHAGNVMEIHPPEGVLTGTPGIGLALLAAATDIEPIWDAMFLTSTR